MNSSFSTDEDRMIHRLIIHRNMITWLLRKLEAEGIRAERTTGNDPNGDILLINSDDVPRVQQLIREIQTEYNS